MERGRPVCVVHSSWTRMKIHDCRNYRNKLPIRGRNRYITKFDGSRESTGVWPLLSTGHSSFEGHFSIDSLRRTAAAHERAAKARMHDERISKPHTLGALSATTSFFTHHLRRCRRGFPSMFPRFVAIWAKASWAKARETHLLSGAPLAGLLPVVMWARSNANFFDNSHLKKVDSQHSCEDVLAKCRQRRP